MKWMISLLLGLSACAHRPLPKPGQSELLYPFGTYEHRVQIEVFVPARTMQMHGVIQSSADRLKVIGLSSFGTTVFRIDENLKTGAIQKEFFVEALRTNQDKFLSFYQLLKELLRAPKGQTEFSRGDAKFTLSAPDENMIYRHVRIAHSQVNLNLDVTKYAF